MKASAIDKAKAVSHFSVRFAVIMIALLVITNSPLVFTIAVVLMYSVFRVVPDQTQGEVEYMNACTNHSTAMACRRAMTGSCENIRAVFDLDPEWSTYRTRLCEPTNKDSANSARILRSYDPARCMFGACDSACTTELQGIQVEVQSFSCPPLSEEVDVEYDASSTLKLAPVSGSMFAIVSWVAIGVALACMLLRLLMVARTKWK